MKKDLVLLTTSQLLFDMAGNAINIFGIIFFYNKLGHSLILATLPFILLHFLHAFFLPLFIKYVIKIGVKKAIIIAAFIYILADIVVFISNDHLNAINLITWASLYALGNIFYYVPFMYILGRNTTHNNRGKIFGLRRILSIVTNVLLPVFAGLISQYFGLQGLMISCILFYCLTVIPIFKMSNFPIEENKSIRKLIKTHTGKKILFFNLNLVFSSDLSNFWPLFVFLLIGSSYTNLGLLFTCVCFISIVISYAVGIRMDRDGRQKYLSIVVITTPISWLIRFLATNYISLLIADSIYNVNNSFKDSVLEVIDYDLLNDREGQQMRISLLVLSETIQNYLITLAYFVFALMITLIGFSYSFIVAAIISFILMQVVKRKLNYPTL